MLESIIKKEPAMKSISCTVRHLILASSLIALPALAADDAAKAPVAGKAASPATTQAAEGDKKKEAPKSPYLLQQPKQQQHNKHKNEKLFDKKENSKKPSEIKK
jgi:hypothetical protein